MYMDSSSLNTLLPRFWTEKKCGKHKDLVKQHGLLLLKDLVAKPEDLFEQLEQNIFTFKPFDKIQWSEFLQRAKLAEYLKPAYIEDALGVSTSRPAIGRGEFLFVSCFANIGFSKNTGDLVDLRNGTRVEFKGIRSTLSGDGQGYKQMNQSLLYSVFALFDTSTQYTSFNRECAKDIDELLAQYPEKTANVLGLLQNSANTSKKIARMFAQLYTYKPDIFNVVGAMQLYMYMLHQKASFLLMTNQQYFCCFAAPKSPIDAFNIVKSIKLSSWSIGNRAMTVGI